MNRMGQCRIGRSLITGVVVCAFLAITTWSAEQYRTFTNTQARSFEGELKAFNAIEETVSIQRADGRTGKMPLAVFSEQDRKYIRNWGCTNDFMTGIKVAAFLEAYSVSAEETDFDDVTKQVKDFRFNVQLKNQSTTAFGKINVEYCLFYRQGERDGSTIQYDEGICHSEINVESLASADLADLETKYVRLYSAAGQQTLFGSLELSDAEVRGLWLRMKMKLPSGEELIREYRTAEDDFWKWSDYSIGAGLNKGDSGTGYYFVP